MAPKARHVIVAGAGIAGLTTAIAFARKGYAVQVLERAPQLSEAGAGLQLSPNAAATLAGLEALEGILPVAVRPDHVSMRDAATLAEKGRVALGDFAETRWGAPYLTVHRADLQTALAARLAREMDVEILTGSTVRDVAFHRRGVTVSTDRAGRVVDMHARLLVAADGVWSTLRRVTGRPADRFSGYVAWRAMVRSGDPLLGELAVAGDVPRVTAFMARDFHVVCYPVRAGTAVNLVAITRGSAMPSAWDRNGDMAVLTRALAGSRLARLVDHAGPWTAWPLHSIDPRGRWTEADGLAFVGDAAHAMLPFAAQGAAMAIEDAATLAAMLSDAGDDVAAGLKRWEAARHARVAKVARRGDLNRFAWHASGPVAAARDVMLRLRSPESLAKDMDWLYGWKPPG